MDWGIEHFGIFPIFFGSVYRIPIFFRILKIASDFQKNKEIRKNRELHYTIFIGNFGILFGNSEFFRERLWTETTRDRCEGDSRRKQRESREGSGTAMEERRWRNHSWFQNRKFLDRNRRKLEIPFWLPPLGMMIQSLKVVKNTGHLMDGNFGMFQKWHENSWIIGTSKIRETR